MTQLLCDTVELLLTEEGFKVDRVKPIVPATEIDEDDTTTFRIFVQGQQGEWSCMVRCFSATSRLLVYSLYPEQAPESLRPRMSELISRINYGLIFGNFEMDWEDGELRYKTSMDIEDIELTSTILRNLVYGNFHSFDLYFHAIAQGLNTERELDIIVMEAENPDMPRGFDLLDEMVH
ncbi:YbjN domain-containing protein [Alkanindiges sp. WGS2144]|uniref:YbjN domain-containing protein n=1 Tax=Alkanindiges sp. WGS2144 TaxID=3366808 RepID=UPI003752A4A7